LAAVNNNKRVIQELLQKKQEEAESDQGSVAEGGERLTDQFNLDALDPIVASEEDGSSILTRFAAIVGISGFAAAICYKYKKYFTNRISSFGNKKNRRGSWEES
jgi:hypothetical protein